MKTTHFLSNIHTYTGGTVELTHPVTGATLTVGIKSIAVKNGQLEVLASWVAELKGGQWQDATTQYLSIYHIGKVGHFEDEVEAPSGDGRVFLCPKGISPETGIKEKRKRGFYFYPPKDGKPIGIEMYVTNY